MEEQVYCIQCDINYDEDEFDYRFDEPICFDCVDELELEPDNGQHNHY